MLPANESATLTFELQTTNT